MGKVISELGLILYVLLNKYECFIKVDFPNTRDPIQNCSKSDHAVREVTCSMCYKSSPFCTLICTGKMTERQAVLKTVLKA